MSRRTIAWMAGAACWLAPASARPDDTELARQTDSPNVIFADLSLGVLGVGYERVFTDDFSVQIAAQYYRPWYVSDTVFGVGGEGRLNFFLWGAAPEGVYLAPAMRAYWATESRDDVAESYSGIALSWKLTVGYSLVLWDTLVLRLGIGPQVHSVNIAPGDAEPDFLTAYVAADLFVGAAF